MLNAQRQATKVGTAAQQLGGTVLSKGATASTESASAAAPATEPDAPAEPEGPHPLLAVIEAQPGVAALQKLWAANRPVFDADETLMAAYKAKGKALQTAGQL